MIIQIDPVRFSCDVTPKNAATECNEEREQSQITSFLHEHMAHGQTVFKIIAVGESIPLSTEREDRKREKNSPKKKTKTIH